MTKGQNGYVEQEPEPAVRLHAGTVPFLVILRQSLVISSFTGPSGKSVIVKALNEAMKG